MRSLLRHILLVICISQSTSLFAQQITQFSQYLNNYYLVNPAATDLNGYLNIDFSYRRQETGQIQGLSSSYLSIYGTLSSSNSSQYMSHGFRDRKRIQNSTAAIFNPKLTPVIGAIISKDNFGLVDRSTFHFSTGLHLPLNEKYTISTAATVGSVLLNVSNDYYILENNDVPFWQFINGFDRERFLDLGLGIWLYSDQLQFGYGIERMFSGNSLEEGNDESFKITSNHFISIGFKMNITGDLQIIPTLLQRIDNTDNIGVDYTVKAIYKNRIWSTVSLRRKSILVFNMGFAINPTISINYSYDNGSLNQGIESLSANEFALKFNLQAKK